MFCNTVNRKHSINADKIAEHSERLVVALSVIILGKDKIQKQNELNDKNATIDFTKHYNTD